MWCEVWLASTGDPRHRGLLDPVERAREFLLPADRARFTAAAGLLRHAVRTHTGTNPVVTRRCPDCDRPHGKPIVPGTGLHVSVSHSGDLVAVAVTAAAPVGIDVELGSDLGWSRWESVVKATGEGMRVPFFPVSSSLISYRGAPLAATVRDLDVGPDHVGAVTVLARGRLDVAVISCGSR